MNLGFYSAATSAYYQQQRLNVIANNSANVHTVGFKAAKPSFSALLYTNVTGIDDEQLARGAGARMEKADTDFSQGIVQETSVSTDYMIDGEGFFALRDMQTGEITYTRAGNFQMAQFGDTYYLTDNSGYRYVLDQQGQPIEAARDENGIYDYDAKLPVGVFAFDQKNGMQHVENNRFIPVVKNGAVRQGTGQVMQGLLESSNTDLSYELSKIIEAQRAFSYALTMVRTSDEVETTINGLRG